MRVPFVIKKKKLHLFLLSNKKRYYMSHREIEKFKNNGKENNKHHLNIEKKNIGHLNREGCVSVHTTTPFEIFKWSNILNTKNEKVINDIINRQNQQEKVEKKGEKKKKKKNLTLLDINKIIHHYRLIINVNENDIFIEKEIQNVFYNIINDLSYYFDKCDTISMVLKNIIKNESLFFYLIYNNMKYIHALPFKIFWKYQNVEEFYKNKNINEYENDENEYIFKSVDLGHIDYLLKDEDALNNTSNNNETKITDVEHVTHNKEEKLKGEEGNTYPHFYDKKTIWNYNKYDFIEKNVKHIMDIPNKYNMTTLSYKHINHNKKRNISLKTKHMNGNIFKTWELFKREKKYFMSTLASSNNVYDKMERKHFNEEKNNNQKEEENRDKKINHKNNIIYNGTNQNNHNNNNNNNNNTMYHDNNVTNNINVETKDHVITDENELCNNIKMVEENDFMYDIKMLDKKIINLNESEKNNFRTSKVPVSPLSRASVFGKVFFDIAKNSSIEYIKNKIINKNVNKYSNNNNNNNRMNDEVNSDNNYSSIIMNEKNAEILANGLSKMRGVVLKLGQMISLQDEYLSPILIKALKIVHNSADIMPKNQLIQVLKKEIGEDYEKKFDYFNYEPFASASIGQVHDAIINKKKKVAVKIQYPGVYESIDSDIKNLLFINQYTNLILKNLYIENLCNVIQKELKCECDYINEAKYYALFKNIFKNSKYFYVPSIYPEYITKHVLVTSYVNGITLDEVSKKLPQPIRDSIGQRILYLCLHELFVFKVMNTDPNLGNFLYDIEKDKLCLIDFGATRSYKNEFVDQYLRLVKASIEEDQSKIYHYSFMLNFFNGQENQEMKTSHIKSVILVGEPFKTDIYDFGHRDIAKQIYNLLPKIIYNRLVPPRSEIYTLHRKLSGCYLICMKLKAKVRAAQIFNSIYQNYRFTIDDTYVNRNVDKQ
ncbi:ABC1 family [Plasmodium falciparum NF54]|uniref:ABC1 family, putative n=4 Tax=Plasmodium falciparum TaxID=5833 RepID=Q8IAT7_PLAF7|nr:ABC1 family, putative [Plasmodium falciparum 3D7]KAF4330376.1 ABC1 family [Plasmodium falciparum NF54]CAD51273.1 ABC1 family, putative [Plasmodium falciparum 3D7]|eukprot:XP_001349424.1 ABC1 family, putative [Plasmodium falciparum 3D7]